MQAVAADLSRISSHSRVLVTAAAEQRIIPASQRAPICQALTSAALAWVRVAEAWTGRHTATPAAPSKIATSHALGRALMDITRDGNSWATTQTVAARVDLHRALGAVRRAHDVGTEAAEHQPQVLQALVHSGVLFVPARSVSTTVERLKTRGRGE